MKLNAIRRAIALCLTGAASLASAQSADYVLQAGQWGSAQKAAVEAVGGKIRYSHRSGMAWVASDRADFAQTMMATGLFGVAVKDLAVKQPAVRTAEFSISEDAVTFPITDTFYQYIQWAPQSVGAPQAWAAGFTGAGVRVAIIDGGIHGTHIDLASAIDTARALSPPDLPARRSGTAIPAPSGMARTWPASSRRAPMAWASSASRRSPPSCR
jgi:subtilisin family serine protease